MGYTWEVSVWGQHHLPYNNDQYSDKTVYGGENLIRAIYVFWKHRNKFGCVSLHYRGGRP